MSFNFSRFFKSLIIATLIAVIVNITPALAASKGSDSYSYSDSYGGYTYTGTVNWSWHMVETKKGEIWTIDYNGSWDTYYLGVWQDGGTWTEHSHQKVSNGQLLQYHGTSKGTNNSTYDYKYTTTIVKGQIVMTHYWSFGRLIK